MIPYEAGILLKAMYGVYTGQVDFISLGRTIGPKPYSHLLMSNARNRSL